MQLIFVIGMWAFLILGPGVPLCLTWWQLLFSPRHANRQNAALPVTLLIVVTLSFLWLMAGLLRDTALGPSYSRLRYTVMEVNFLIDILAVVVGATIKTARNPLLILSAYAVSFDWFFAGVVNSVV